MPDCHTCAYSEPMDADYGSASAGAVSEPAAFNCCVGNGTVPSDDLDYRMSRGQFRCGDYALVEERVQLGDMEAIYTRGAQERVIAAEADLYDQAGHRWPSLADANVTSIGVAL